MSRNLLLALCAIFLGGMALASLGADWIAPYAPQEEFRAHPYHPPTRIHFFDEKNGLSLFPFVYKTEMTFDEHYRRIYTEDKSQRYFVKFAVPHLFNVESPGRVYLFGTDSRGRDLFSRILHGGRISLSIGILGACFAAALGLLIGSVSGYFGGWLDEVLMRIAEFFIMVPAFYLLLALRSALPAKIDPLHVYLLTAGMLSLVGWGGMARVIRGLVLSIKQNDFIRAAKSLGRSDGSILAGHVLPHTLSYLAVVVSISVPSYILTESALSILGLGIQEPYVSWGSLLSEASSVAHLELHPWVLIPGLFLIAAAWCFNVLGDQLKPAGESHD